MAVIGLPPFKKHKMKDVVPLDTPYTVLVSITDFCNINCNFCSYHGSAKQHPRPDCKSIMSLDFYKKIIDQLSEFPNRLSRLTFSGYGEPTPHKDFPEMAYYAQKKDIADQIMLVTNGILFSPEYNLKIVKSGVNYIRVSVPAIDSQTAYDIVGHKVDIEGSYLENIKHLYKNKNKDTILLLKTTNYALGGKGGKDPDPELVEKFYSMFGDYCDYIFVENVAPWAGTDEKNVAKQGLDKLPEKDMNGRERVARRFCEFLFYMLTIDSVGNIRPCCMAEAPLIGKFGGSETLKQIWDSKHLLDLRLAHLDEKLLACIDCGVNSFIDTQNIDNDVETIRNKLIGKP